MRLIHTITAVVVILSISACGPGMPVAPEAISAATRTPSPSPAPQTATPGPTAPAPAIIATPEEAAESIPGLVPDRALARLGKGAITALAARQGLLAVGTTAGICLYEEETLVELWCGRVERPVQSLAMSPDGTRLAASLNDGTLLLWDLPSQTVIAQRRISAFEGSNYLDFSPDGTLLAVVESGNLSLWNGLTLENGEDLSTTPSFFGPARFSPDGRHLAWIDHPSGTQHVRIRDLQSGETRLAFDLPLWSHSLDWAPDGGTLIAGLAGDIGCYENCEPSYETAGGLLFYNLAAGELSRIDFDIPDAAVGASVMSPDGNRLALHTGAFFPQILLVDLLDPIPVALDIEPHPYLRALAWTSSGEALHFLQDDGRLGSWDARAGIARDAGLEGYGLQSWVQALSPDGALLARYIDGPERRLTIQAVPEGTELAALDLPETYPAFLRWDPEGGRLVIAGYEGLQIYHPESGELQSLRPFDPESGDQVESGAWTADGSSFVVGVVRWLDDQFFERIEILDAGTGQILNTIEGAGVQFSLSPGGGRLAAHRWSLSGATGYLSILDMATGRLEQEIVLDFGLYAFAWTPDGKSIAAYQDRSLILIDIPSGQQLWSRSLGNLHQETAGVNAIAVSADGRWIVTAGYELAIWDASTGELIQVLEGHSGVVRALAVTPDGRSVVTAGEDGTAILWAMP